MARRKAPPGDGRRFFCLLDEGCIGEGLPTIHPERGDSSRFDSWLRHFRGLRVARRSLHLPTSRRIPGKARPPLLAELESTRRRAPQVIARALSRRPASPRSIRTSGRWAVRRFPPGHTGLSAESLPPGAAASSCSSTCSRIPPTMLERNQFIRTRCSSAIQA